jgi:hypothetical protein
MHVCRFQPQIWELRKLLSLRMGIFICFTTGLLLSKQVGLVAATSKYRISSSLDSKALLLIRNFIFELKVQIQRSLWRCCRKNRHKDKYVDFHFSQYCGRQVMSFRQQNARLVTILNNGAAASKSTRKRKRSISIDLLQGRLRTVIP